MSGTVLRSIHRTFLPWLLVLCALALIASIALWMRSSATADRLHGNLGTKRSFIVSSKQGAVTIAGFDWHGAANFAWDVRSEPATNMTSFPVGPVDQYRNRLGFGTISNPIYFVMQPVQAQTVFLGAASATLRGTAIVIPWWSVVTVTGAAAMLTAFVWLRTRRRYAAGRCVACGYDLRSSAGDCPECGASQPQREVVPGDHSLSSASPPERASTRS